MTRPLRVLSRPGERSGAVLKIAPGTDDVLSMTIAPGDDLAQLSLDELRAHRRALLTESANASRWKRLLQARVDLAVAGTAPADPLRRPSPALPEPPDHNHLRDLVESMPDDPIGLLQRLNLAQQALSGYGAGVEAAASLATRELVERYVTEPGSCLQPPEPVG